MTPYVEVVFNIKNKTAQLTFDGNTTEHELLICGDNLYFRREFTSEDSPSGLSFWSFTWSPKYGKESVEFEHYHKPQEPPGLIYLDDFVLVGNNPWRTLGGWAKKKDETIRRWGNHAARVTIKVKDSPFGYWEMLATNHKHMMTTDDLVTRPSRSNFFEASCTEYKLPVEK